MVVWRSGLAKNEMGDGVSTISSTYATGGKRECWVRGGGAPGAINFRVTSYSVGEYLRKSQQINRR